MFRPLIILFIFFFAASSQAAIYQWTNEQGNIAYGKTPPRDKTIKRQEVSTKTPKVDAVKQAKSIEESANEIAKSNASRKAAIDKAAQAAQDKRLVEEDCTRANKALSALALGGNRLYKDSEGKQARLSEEDKNLQRQKLNAFINENCR
ncbi:MAG: DUF4124 domain-containing protein [Cycloclasticus sp.]